MVEKLYLEDAYVTKCEAVITMIDGNCIQLDKTIFYAFSGGQISDLGTINGIEVVEARKLNDEDIEYELREIGNLKVGDRVSVQIDWKQRYELMRLHSAQHIVADFFEQVSGINTTLGSNVRLGKATLTYSCEESIVDMLLEVEKLVCSFIKEGHDIKRFASVEQSNRWIYECGTFSCPCGGTHVKNTSEIGEIKIKRKNGGKGKETIEIMLV